MLAFPKEFWWGGATSGPQSEGRFAKQHRNLFDYWYEEEPDLFYDYVGPDTASDAYHQFGLVSFTRSQFLPHLHSVDTFD